MSEEEAKAAVSIDAKQADEAEETAIVAEEESPEALVRWNRVRDTQARAFDELMLKSM